jgi:DNA polymerase-3 subunit gamma/tau
MSYEVLARKWRPLTFDEIVGQDHVTRTLKKAVETDRVSHAYMFAGPRGCGKTSTARIMARVINCQNPPGDGNPCNECESCKAVIRGSNLDVMEIDGASHTGVGEVRDLQESIGYTSSQYRNKVYVIDEVHMLSTHAFNALLKTLEEPPKHVYFIFATTAPHKIPDTIKSRCQRHYFKRMEIKEIAGQLRVICEAEGVQFEDGGLRLLSRKADGSMRDGTSLLDQCITSSDGNVTAESVRDILGLIDQEKVFAFIEGIADGDPTKALRLLNENVDEGIDVQEMCTALLEGYRDLMVLAAPGDLSDLLFRSKDEIELLRGLLSSYELPDLVTIVGRLCDATPRLKLAADPKIMLESLLVDLTLLDRQVDICRLITELESSGGGNVSRGRGRGRADPPRSESSRGKRPKDKAAAEDRETDAASGSASLMKPATSDRSLMNAGANSKNDPEPLDGSGDGVLDAEKLKELWEGFVTFVRQKKFRLGVCLISGKFHTFDGDTLLLRFAKSFESQKEQVEKPESIQFLRRTMIEFFGRDAKVVCIMEGEERGRQKDSAKKVVKSTSDGLRGIPEDKVPLIKKLIEEFDGEIIRHNP